MEWVAIIAALMQVFGPILAEWLKKCMEERMEEAAKNLPVASSFASEADAADALFDEMIAGLPRFAFIRRAAFRRMKQAARDGDKVRTAPLTPAEIEEARDLAAGVRSE